MTRDRQSATGLAVFFNQRKGHHDPAGGAIPVITTAADGPDKTAIVLDGRIRVGRAPFTAVRRVEHPAWFLGQTLAAELRRVGIDFRGRVTLGKVPERGVRPVVSVLSRPLGEILRELNKRSVNFVAEQIIRTLGADVHGAPGTHDKGLTAVANHLEALGLPKGSYQLDNGSGLYASNRFSARQLLTVLRATLSDFRLASEYLTSLPISGVDGTLSKRMAKPPTRGFVRAKTGTLSGVSCLSGVVGAPQRPPLLFSVLMNDVPGSFVARRIQDAFVETLVRFLWAFPPPSGAPRGLPSSPALGAL